VQDALVEEGSEAGLDGLYRQHGAKLWRSVYAYSGDADVANDAVAEAFVQALRRGDELRSPLSWIWRAAFRIAAGTLKDRSREVHQIPEAPYEMEEQDWELLSALAQLPQAQRAALVFYYYADQPIAEIARALGSNAVTVRASLSRGRRRLRKLLEEKSD
jgi:RNA polymerase sigma-70 factor (ECF subfamily)